MSRNVIDDGGPGFAASARNHDPTSDFSCSTSQRIRIELEEMTQGLPRAEAYHLIAARVRHDIVNLRDRTSVKFDAQVLHQQWQAERRSGKLRIEASDEQFATAEA